MALYQYAAFSKQGKRKIGMVHADSLDLAKERVRAEGFLITKIKLYSKRGERVKIPPSLLIGLTRDLHVLLRAGLPLYDTLLTLEEKYEKTALHPIVLSFCDQVKQGYQFSDALREYPKVFDLIYLSMVRAGEASGALERSFAQLEKLMTQQHILKKKLTTAMIYPIFLGVFCMVVISILLFFLIPSMSALFEERALHPMTQGVLALSVFLNRHVVAISAFLLGIGGVTTLYVTHPKGKKRLRESLLYFPIFKRFFTETILARFCRVFSVLFQGGISMLDCLQLSKQVMKHDSFEKVISRAQKKILEGKRLSEELGKSPLIPILVVRMLAIAEETGQVAEMMGHVSTIYEQDIERSLTRLTAILQPVLLLFLGLVVAVVLLAVLLPLIDVGSMVN